MIEVLRDMVAVLPMEDPDMIGHIIIPETAKQNPDQGIIYAKGPDVTEVKIGDHVFFQGYAGSRVSIEGEGSFVILREEQCLAVLLDNPNPMLPVSEVKRLLQKVVIDSDDYVDIPERFLTILDAHFFSEGLDF